MAAARKYIIQMSPSDIAVDPESFSSAGAFEPISGTNASESYDERSTTAWPVSSPPRCY